MIQARSLATMVALCSIAALPACSMFGGGDNHRQASRSYPSYASAQPANAMPQAPELTPDMTQQVQQKLQQDGLYRGPIDGVWGPGTEAAMRTYQQQHNLNASGKLDAETLASLNVGPQEQRYGSNYNPPPRSNPPANMNSNTNTNTNQPNPSNTR
jgi:peptidoglycan hydrolase-like protein with peptidoglycan-binding domain